MARHSDRQVEIFAQLHVSRVSQGLALPPLTTRNSREAIQGLQQADPGSGSRIGETSVLPSPLAILDDMPSVSFWTVSSVCLR